MNSPLKQHSLLNKRFRSSGTDVKKNINSNLNSRFHNYYDDNDKRVDKKL